MIQWQFRGKHIVPVVVNAKIANKWLIYTYLYIEFIFNSDLGK